MPSGHDATRKFTQRVIEKIIHAHGRAILIKPGALILFGKTFGLTLIEGH
jgi:hypothetical protein